MKEREKLQAVVVDEEAWRDVERLQVRERKSAAERKREKQLGRVGALASAPKPTPTPRSR